MRKFVKYSIVVAMLIIIAVIIGLVTARRNVNKNKDAIVNQQTVKVAIYTKDMAGLPYMVMKENKLLEKQELIPEYKEVDGTLLLNILIDNQADVAMGTSWPSLGGLEIEKPGLIKIAGAGGEKASEKPMNGILVLPDGPIKTIGDLKGKTIAGENPRNNLVLKIILRKFNIDPEKEVKIIEIGKALISEALVKNEADAIFVFQPSLSLIEEKIGARAIETNIRSKYIIDPYFSGPLMMVTNDYLINNRPIIKKFAVAIEEATKFIAENPEQAKLIATKYTALTLDLVEKTGIHFYVGPLSPLDKDKVQTVLNILSDGGILKQKINIQDMYFNP